MAVRYLHLLVHLFSYEVYILITPVKATGYQINFYHLLRRWAIHRSHLVSLTGNRAQDDENKPCVPLLAVPGDCFSPRRQREEHEQNQTFTRADFWPQGWKTQQVSASWQVTEAAKSYTFLKDRGFVHIRPHWLSGRADRVPTAPTTGWGRGFSRTAEPHSGGQEWEKHPEGSQWIYGCRKVKSFMLEAIRNSALG